MMNRCKANYQLNNNKEWYELYFGSCGRIGREVDEMAVGGIAIYCDVHQPPPVKFQLTDVSTISLAGGD